MNIRRDDLGKTDYAEFASGKRLAPVHSGDVLRKDLAEPPGVSRYRLARNFDGPQRRIDLMRNGNSLRGAPRQEPELAKPHPARR